MADVIAYIDGFNLYYGAVKKRPADRWLDVASLMQALVPTDSVSKVKYFTARISPQADDPDAPRRQNTYLRALAALPTVELHYGHYSTNPKWRALAEEDFPLEDLFRPPLRPAFLARWIWKRTARDKVGHLMKAHIVHVEEKGSDVNLAAHLMYDTFELGRRDALVISNDTDLVEPIRMCVAKGSTVRVCNPGGGSVAGGLRKVASQVVPLDKAILAHHQLPSPLRLPNGKLIHRPAEWV